MKMKTCYIHQLHISQIFWVSFSKSVLQLFRFHSNLLVSKNNRRVFFFNSRRLLIWCVIRTSILHEFMRLTLLQLLPHRLKHFKIRQEGIDIGQNTLRCLFMIILNKRFSLYVQGLCGPLEKYLPLQFKVLAGKNI